jgi:DNA replication licensing factor MCM2
VHQPIPQEILRKYILYAKTRCHPRLTRIDRDKISKLYAELRRESMTNGSIPMTVRHVESIIRMTEAHAKMHLREYCTADDVNMAIRVMLNSFINSQKFSISRSLRNTFRKYITYKRDHIELCHHFLLILVNETVRYHQARDKGQLPATIEIDCEEFESRVSIRFLVGILIETHLTEFYLRCANTTLRISNRSTRLRCLPRTNLLMMLVRELFLRRFNL